jgi:hypothetical protein
VCLCSGPLLSFSRCHQFRLGSVQQVAQRIGALAFAIPARFRPIRPTALCRYGLLCGGQTILQCIGAALGIGPPGTQLCRFARMSLTQRRECIFHRRQRPRMEASRVSLTVSPTVGRLSHRAIGPCERHKRDHVSLVVALSAPAVAAHERPAARLLVPREAASSANVIHRAASSM